MQTQSDAAPSMKVWQAWPGEGLLFFRDGKCMLARKWYGAAATLAVLIVPLGLYLAFVAAQLSRPWDIVAICIGFPVHPSLVETLVVTHTEAYPLQSSSAALGIASCTFLVQTAVTDPGILPKLKPDADYLRMQKPRQKEVTIQGSPFLLRYDDTYHFYRPPRAHHCTETNVVVEKFDHFCPWVGNTIGARNYVHFVRFLASALLLTATTMGFCVLRITQHVQRVSADGNSFLDSLLDIVAAPLIVLYCISFTFALAGLLGFHTYLICIGLTTYEHIRHLPRVFGGSCASNWHSLCCLPILAPFTDFSETIEDAERRDPPDLIKLWNPPWCAATQEPVAAAVV